MTTNFNLTSGKNRALVCYCNTDAEATDIDALIDSVFASQNIEPDPLAITIDDRNSKPRVFKYNFDPPQSALNIALEYNNVVKRLKVGSTFNDVNVGVFFYDQPVPPPEPEPDPDDPTELEEEDEPIPPPSITSLVCDALREAFGGVYGASSFVVPATITEFTLEVE